MSKKKKLQNLMLVLILVMPLLGIGFQGAISQYTVWIVNSNHSNPDTILAVETIRQEVASSGCEIRETSLDNLKSIPLQSDFVVLVGHGDPEGLEDDSALIPWSELYSEIEERQPLKTVVLACNSPTDKSSNIYGFRGQVDAEAGALLATWHIMQSINPEKQNDIPLSRVAKAQSNMLHPLEVYLYFVHGYFGSDAGFGDMASWLELWDVDDRYDGIRYFSYWQSYWDLYQGQYDNWDDFMHVMHFDFTIADYATDFRDFLIAEHQNEGGVQIDIVAHSMGGLITREMLRLSRTTLNLYDIDFGRIATIGTPHEGTNMAVSGLSTLVRNLVEAFYGTDDWDTPVFGSMAPESPFLTTLNANPASYQSGIGWYTIAGEDTSAAQIILWFVHYDVNDLMVPNGRAHVANSLPILIPSCDHSVLIDDSLHRSADYIDDYFLGGRDADSDGLLDVEEKFNTGTNYLVYDTDGDGLSDGEEVLTYGTNPLSTNSDGDALGDAQEVDWGYNPTNPNDPIPASSLIYKSWHSNGITGYVRANHYSAMDYVEVYVKYKDAGGWWTSYYYVATDTTPYYYGDYYVIWSLRPGYVQMCVNVKAYDSSNHYLGADAYYVSLPTGGGGDPPTPPIE